MAFFRTTGIVLKKHAFGEYDEIISLLSPDYGRMRIFAKGVRKMKSSLSGILDLFCEVSLSLASGRSFDLCSQAVIIDSHSPLRNDLTVMSAGIYFLEVCDRILPFMEKDEKGFILLKRAIAGLEAGENPSVFIPVVLFAVLKHQGFEPCVSQCCVCGGKSRMRFFDAPLGGLVCSRCRSTDSIFLEDEVLAVFSMFSRYSLKAIRAKSECLQIYLKIRACLEDYVRFHCGFQIRSSDFTGKVLCG